MKKFLTVLMILIVSSCAGCGGENYGQITHDEAKKIMATNPAAIILDVRTQEEFDKKHIADAMLLPLDDLKNGDFVKLPDKSATILVYCRTGRRSKEAAQILSANGYKNVYDFGGIVDWTGEVEGTDTK